MSKENGGNGPMDYLKGAMLSPKVPSVVIPLSSAILVTAPYMWTKQLQAYVMKGTKPESLFNGFGPTLGQQVGRFLLRFGPVPLANTFAIENHPDWMSEKAAKNASTIVVGVAADALLTPTEGMAQRQQTWKKDSAVPKPSYRGAFREHGLGWNLTKDLWRGTSAVIPGKTLYFASVVLGKELMLGALGKEAHQLNKSEAIEVMVGGAAIAAFGQVLGVSIACAQMEQQCCHNPTKKLIPAFKKGIEKGLLSTTVRVGPVRVPVTLVSTLAGVGTLLAQDYHKNWASKEAARTENQNNAQRQI